MNELMAVADFPTREPQHPANDIDDFTLEIEHQRELVNPEPGPSFNNVMDEPVVQLVDENNLEEEWDPNDLWDVSSLPPIDPIDRFELDSNIDEETEPPYEFNDSWQLEQQQQEEFQSFFKTMLIWWVFTFNIGKAAVSALLRILSLVPVLSFLPKTYNTLLKTPRSVPIEDLEPGKYFHAGFREGIFEAIDSLFLKPESLNEIGIFINIDGVPLSQSSNSDFWPILGRLHYPTPSKPFVTNQE